MAIPSPDQELRSGDLLVIVGSHAEIERAFHLSGHPVTGGSGRDAAV